MEDRSKQEDAEGGRRDDRIMMGREGKGQEKTGRVTVRVRNRYVEELRIEDGRKKL